MAEELGPAGRGGRNWIVLLDTLVFDWRGASILGWGGIFRACRAREDWGKEEGKK